MYFVTAVQGVGQAQRFHPRQPQTACGTARSVGAPAMLGFRALWVFEVAFLFILFLFCSSFLCHSIVSFGV